MASKLDSAETFPLLLTRYREQQSLSKAKLARLLGVSAGYVYLLEKGKSSPPTLARVEQLVELLQLSPEETEAFTVAAAAGRTGAAEAKVLRQTGPRQVVFPAQAMESEGPAGFQDRIDLRDCVAIPVQTDAMAPVLCAGQLAICARTCKPTAGDLVIATLQNGQVHIGQYYPSEDEVLLTALRPEESSATPSVARSSIRELLPVIGILFKRDLSLKE